MPFSDIDIALAKKLFDLNVWGCLAVTQAFLPLLLESQYGGMVVNHTSVGSLIGIPFQSAYNASKAAMAIFSDTQRLELEPFGVRVVEIKTGGALSRFLENKHSSDEANKLPKDSIYDPVREIVEHVLQGEDFKKQMQPAEQWARDVARDLTRKGGPPSVIWRGKGAGTVRALSFAPHGWLDGELKKMSKMDAVGDIVGREKGERRKSS